MSAIIGALLFGQIAITNVRRNEEQIPVNLAISCTLSRDTLPARQVEFDFRGSIGPGSSVRVRLSNESGIDIQAAGDRDSIMLNGADDHTQNQIFNNFVTRVDGRKYLATLSINYPTVMPRPASFDNSVPIKSAELKLEDFKSYRTVAVGGEQLYVTKVKHPPVYARGGCILRQSVAGSAG